MTGTYTITTPDLMAGEILLLGAVMNVFAINAALVPEPASIYLLATAIAGLITLRRKAA